MTTAPCSSPRSADRGSGDLRERKWLTLHKRAAIDQIETLSLAFPLQPLVAHVLVFARMSLAERPRVGGLGLTESARRANYVV